MTILSYPSPTHRFCRDRVYFLRCEHESDLTDYLKILERGVHYFQNLEALQPRDKRMLVDDVCQTKETLHFLTETCRKRDPHLNDVKRLVQRIAISTNGREALQVRGARRSNLRCFRKQIKGVLCL